MFRRRRKPVVSVVMPVYDVEDYLRECLDSVLSQDVALELIAVDDSSRDSSPEILREYERRDRRVRVLTQPNAGQGPARNAGVALARGEYLTFVDSDDVVPPGSLAAMVAQLESSGSDLVLGGVRRLRRSGPERMGWARTVFDRDRTGVDLGSFPAAMLDIVTHHRMFRTDFWREQCPPFEPRPYEDHIPMLMAFVNAERFDVLKRVVYEWRIREDQTSTSQQKASLPNLRVRLEVLAQAHDLLAAQAPSFLALWVARVLDVDLPPFLKHAVGGTSEYQQVLGEAFAHYLSIATPAALARVTARQRIRAELAAAGRWEELLEADAWFDDVGLMPPARVADGAVVPWPAPFALDVSGIALSPVETHFQGVLASASASGSVVRVVGWALRRAVGVDEPPKLRAWVGDAEVPAEPVWLAAAQDWGQQRYSAYGGAGFVVTFDTADLPRGRAPLRIRTEYAGITAEGELGERRPGVELPPGLSWDAARGLWIDSPVRAPEATFPPVGDARDDTLGRAGNRLVRDRVLADPPPLVDRVLAVGDVPPVAGAVAASPDDPPRDWYPLLASSRWVVTDRQLGWWAPREGQRWLRVFTEQPVLTDENFEATALERLRVARTWDTVLLTDPAWESVLRDGFGFTGEVLVGLDAAVDWARPPG